jgi:putative two-component system response regulator
MPVMDGFEILNRMSKNRITSLPILLISAESSKENIVKAAQYGLTGFIRKPYDAVLVLEKLKSIFTELQKKYNYTSNINDNNQKVISKSEVSATNQYVERLRRVYLTYLNTKKKSDSLYCHVSEIVHILLENYYVLKQPRDLSPEAIDIISQAAYFYDIGRIVIREENKYKKYSIGDLNNIPETHTIAGADFVGINSSPSVSYFVKTCADMCMHHHERYDGKGFPHGLKSSINNIYTQMVSICIEFCNHFFSEEAPGAREFHISLNSILEDSSAFRPDVIELLQNSQEDIINFYQKKHSS